MVLFSNDSGVCRESWCCVAGSRFVVLQGVVVLCSNDYGVCRKSWWSVLTTVVCAENRGGVF